MAAAILLRPGESQDMPFLRDMVRHTGLDRSGVTIDEEPPPLSRYVVDWGRAGDAALVALDQSTHAPVGAAWYRLFTRAEPGYGFVGEDTPELTVAVVPGRRREGIGQALLVAIVERARASGFASVSVSAVRDDAAVGLVEQNGFRLIRENGTAVIMALDLR
jgi:ribosomal protein S18 acetylase RimI-like enzyme